MFRAGHVVLQYLGDAVAFQRDDALIDLVAVLGIEGDDEAAVSHQILQAAVCQFALPLGGGAQFQITGAFHHQQFDRALAVDLQHKRAFQLERGRQQHGGGAQLAHHVAQYLGVVVAFDHVQPDTVETHDLAAQRQVFKQETAQGIGRCIHGGR